jgi:predicted alpha/beta-fold hydrolase
VQTFTDYLEKVVAPHYEVGAEHLYRHVNVADRIDDVAPATLVVHAVDDPVVPVDHTLEIERRASALGCEHIDVVITPNGGHYGHWAVAPRRTETTVREFLGRCLGPKDGG